MPESELPDRIDWEAVVLLARRHAVLGVIIEGVRFLPERLRPSDAMMAKMNKFALKLIQSNLGLDQKVGRLVSFFEEHGVNGVLLKGQGVARAYRMPQMRQTGDIDFYVGRSQYKKAVALCREYFIEDEADWHESDQHFSFRFEGVTVELHRVVTEIYSPLKKKRFETWIVDEVENSTGRGVIALGDSNVVIPSPDFNAIYIFYHALLHFVFEGIGLRQLCDWAMVLQVHSDEIDYDKLEANIRRFGLTRGWKLFACIVVKYLGVQAEKMPLYDPRYEKQSEKLLEAIITGGNFGFYSKIHALSPKEEYGIGYTLSKVRYLSRKFIHTFPILPAQATCVYVFRMFSATNTASKVLIRTLIGK